VLFVISAIAGNASKPAKTTATAAGSTSTAVPMPTAVKQTTTSVSPTTSATTAAPTTTPQPSTTMPASTGPVMVNSAGAILPNPTRTPGATNPDVTQADIHSTICVSGWTSTIRPESSYTTALKEQQLASGYAYHGDMNTGDYEEDHLISLEIGGSPTTALNLWPEPYNTPDGARTKDQIENKLHELVCDGALSIAAAQHAIATNWYAAYQTYIGIPSSTVPATAATPAPATTAQPASPSSPLTCSASMSNPTPSDNSTDDVIVHTGVAGSSVTATAHYKSTNTTHTSSAAGNGVAEVAFDIGRATVGYQVTVDVTVAAAGASTTCSTAFTPQ
jgi:hypothetical protein